MKKTALLAALISGVALNTHGQRLLGIATGNWAGTNSIYLNPASIADSRTRFAFDLGGLEFGVDNNLASIDLSKALNSTGNAGSTADFFTFSKNNEFNVILPYAEVRLPGVMVSIDEENSVALTTRLRGYNQFNHFDQNLFRSIMDPGNTGSTDYLIKSDNFNWTAHMWTEIKLTYARVVYKQDEHFLKAGISLTRLGGIGFLTVKGNHLDGRFFAANDSIAANNADVEFASNLIDNSSELKSGLGDAFSQFFGKKGGNGWGGDLGIVYEYRPEETNSDDQSDNKYKVRGSIAVTDVGSVKYKSTATAQVTANGYMSAGDFAKHITNFNSFTDYASASGYHLDTSRGETKVHLPTALIIGADYFVASHFYVNATWIGNLANRMNFGNSFYGQFTVTPRWDTRFFSAALPITYSGMTKGIKAGLGLRVSGFILGSDDMLAFLGGKAYGINFYIGGYVPINKKHKTHGSGVTAKPVENNG